MQRFHHGQFSDLEALMAGKNGQRVTVCIPTFNEAETIGDIVESVQGELMERVRLVDEVLVIDSDSTDGTREVALRSGARVFRSSEVAPEFGSFVGKGENLWKALHVASGDIICYIDGDISNFSTHFVTGLIGPLLCHPEIDYVKGYYERPLAHTDSLHSSGGGRVSEILVRPLISVFYPELNGILQPLSGEYAARRSVLESLAFPIGYGVEIAHLIDLAQAGKMKCIAQSDLVRRVHRNRDDGELGDTAFAILRVILRRLERDGKITLATPPTDLHQRWLIGESTVQLVSNHIPEPERPPFMDLAGHLPPHLAVSV